MLRDDSGLLQLPEAMLRKRLLLLHLLQQHAGLLRHVRLIGYYWSRDPAVATTFPLKEKPRAVGGLAASFPGAFHFSKHQNVATDFDEQLLPLRCR
jgi:hypothetical protein